MSTVVRMDSFRSLVDYNIYAGLVPIYAGLVPAAPEGLPVSAEAFAMARRRQHAAHEIGRTLGLRHNFIAAAQDGASVMDYPFPRIELDAQGGSTSPGPTAWAAARGTASPSGTPTPGFLTRELLRRTVQRVVLNTLLDLAGNVQATAEVRAMAEYHLAGLRTRPMAAGGGSVDIQAFREAALRDLDRYFAKEDNRAARSRFQVVPLPWP